MVIVFENHLRNQDRRDYKFSHWTLKLKKSFRLSTLLSIVTIVALALGWFLERTRRLALRDEVRREMASHIHGNVNIQAAWEAYEIASAFAEDPENIKDTLDADLIFSVYRIWQTQQDIDFAFTRRSPGNTALSLANTLLHQLDCEVSKDYFNRASSIPCDPPNTVLDALDLTTGDREELDAFIANALKIEYDRY